MQNYYNDDPIMSRVMLNTQPPCLMNAPDTVM